MFTQGPAPINQSRRELLVQRSKILKNNREIHLCFGCLYFCFSDLILILFACFLGILSFFVRVYVFCFFVVIYRRSNNLWTHHRTAGWFQRQVHTRQQHVHASTATLLPPLPRFSRRRFLLGSFNTRFHASKQLVFANRRRSF